jgi:hypothetical protein
MFFANSIRTSRPYSSLLAGRRSKPKKSSLYTSARQRTTIVVHQEVPNKSGRKGGEA